MFGAKYSIMIPIRAWIEMAGKYISTLVIFKPRRFEIRKIIIYIKSIVFKLFKYTQPLRIQVCH